MSLPMERDVSPFDPPRAIAALRDTRPVSPLTFPDGHEGWLVTGYEAVRQVMADTRFSSRQDLGVIHVPYETPGMPTPTEPSPQMPGLFIAMDPPDHTRLRRKLIGAFTVKRMKALEEQIVGIVERQLDELARLAPPVDLVKAFALPVPSLVICELLGVPYADRETFQTNSAQFLVKDQTLEVKMAALGALNAYLGELVAGKRANPGEDILSDLAQDEDLSIEELVGVAFLLLLAGHETTANMLGLGTFALLEHPGQLAELRTNPDLMPDAVEELMRYLSVVDILFRYAAEDIELDGELIPRVDRRRVDAGRQPRPQALRQPGRAGCAPQGARPPVLRARRAPVPRPATRPHRDARRVRRPAAPVPVAAPGRSGRRGEAADGHEHLRRARPAGHLGRRCPVATATSANQDGGHGIGDRAEVPVRTAR